MAALLFALYTVFSGVQQGIIVWLCREFVPAKYGEWVNAAFHYGGGLIYALIVGYAVYVNPAAIWQTIGAALLLRVALFDPFLNLGRSWFSHREGRAWEPVFAVGSSALTDKALNAVAKALRLNASVLSAGVRVAALVGTIWIICQ